MKKTIVMICKWIHAGSMPSLRTESVSQEKDLEKILEYNFTYNRTLVSCETGMTTDSLSFATANRLQELRHQQSAQLACQKHAKNEKKPKNSDKN